jgi:hypothetical protein
MGPMKALLVSCEVFIREVSLFINRTEHVIFPVYTELGAHEQSRLLQERIQKAIDEAEGKEYDYILLGYGLCGNALNGIRARSVPLVAIRAHDCCTIFLGSKKRFDDLFGEELSSTWSSSGYLERGNDYIHRTDTGKLLGLDKGYDDYVAEYGEENAQFIWETLHPEEKDKPLLFIETEETRELGYCEKCRIMAQEEGKEFSCIEGDSRLLRQLIEGPWEEDDFLQVPPGHRIQALYDKVTIIDSVPGEVEESEG